MTGNGDVGESGFDHGELGALKVGFKSKGDGGEFGFRVMVKRDAIAGVPLVGKGIRRIVFNESAFAVVLIPDHLECLTDLKGAGEIFGKPGEESFGGGKRFVPNSLRISRENELSSDFVLHMQHISCITVRKSSGLRKLLIVAFICY